MTAPALRLSDLAGPDAAGWSDVAVFVRADGSESEPFVVVGHDFPGELYARTAVQRATDASPMSYFSHIPVRRLGRGRLVPARIVMEGEATNPPAADLDAAALRLLAGVDTDASDRILVAQAHRRLAGQVATLREALEEVESDVRQRAMPSLEAIRAALAATAPNPPVRCPRCRDTGSIPVGDGIASADTMDCPSCANPPEAAP